MPSYTGKLKLNIIEAKGLKAADKAGTSDPYVEIHINNEKTKFKTPKIKKTLDPTWNYTTEILLDNCQYLVFKVIDHNLIKGDVDLGQADLSEMQESIDVDTWLPLKDTQGDLHISYKFVPSDALDRRDIAQQVMAQQQAQAAEKMAARRRSSLGGGSSVNLTEDIDEDDFDMDGELSGAGLLAPTMPTRLVDGKPVNESAPHVPLKASPRDVRLTFQGMMKKRVIRPAVIFCAATFGSYAIGYYGFGAIYAVLLLLAFMSVEGVLFRRSLKFAAKDFEQQFDDSHYPATESVEWINGILDRVWFNHPLTISKMVIDSVQPTLDANVIPPLSKLELRKFDIGTKAPNLYNFRVVHADDPCDMEFWFDIDWDWDCDIQVNASSGPISMPLAVRNIVFRARNMVVYVRLVKDKAPYASWAYAQIKEKPRVEFEVKPLGGPSSGMIPGIDLIIRKMFVDNILELLIVVPNRFAIDLAPILDPEATVDDHDKMPVDPKTAAAEKPPSVPPTPEPEKATATGKKSSGLFSRSKGDAAAEA